MRRIFQRHYIFKVQNVQNECTPIQMLRRFLAHSDIQKTSRRGDMLIYLKTLM